MVLLKQRVEPRVRVRIESKQTLAEDISYFGREFEFRAPREQRMHGDREDFCLRRWAIAMVARDRLTLPVTIEGARKGHSPDFIVRWAATDESLALEIAEAGTATWHDWLKGATPGPESPRQSSGTDRDEPIERLVERDVIEAIVRKSADPREAAVGTADLLVYVNTAGGLAADQAAVVAGLRARAAGLAPPFRRVHLLFGDSVHLDVLGSDGAAVDVSVEYAEDWVGWLRAQAGLLAARDVSKLDLANLKEELESLARSDERTLKSQTRRLLLHLLKWRFQRRRRSHSWRVSVVQARLAIEEVLAESPSLIPRLPLFLPGLYAQARSAAARETGLKADTFPDACPFTIDQILDRDFLPDR